jgi:UDP:flavonoid glycosyltransferase YjiC (YdhE family)
MRNGWNIAFECTRKDGAVGVDGQTAESYAANLQQNLSSLIERLKSGRYRAPPVRRPPTAALAARIAAIPSLMIGNGFEFPALTHPLPPFPGLSWATVDKAAASERLALESAAAVSRRFRRPPLTSLCDLFRDATRLFVTLPDLDHYGARADARYVGPLLGALPTEKVDWPAGEKRIFACLRPDTHQVDAILTALHSSHASVICFAPGFSAARLRPFAGKRMQFVTRPVDLGHLVTNADLCVSYGAEGTIMTFLLAGVPQLISPSHVEAHLLARRVEALGDGVVLRGSQTPGTVAEALTKLTSDHDLVNSARRFSARARGDRCLAEPIADLIEHLDGGAVNPPRTAAST